MEEDDRNPRGSQLSANSEEELLAMQEEFLAQYRRPAANVTRVSRRNGSGAPSHPATASPTSVDTVHQHASGAQLPGVTHTTQGRGTAWRRTAAAGAGGGGPEGSIRGDDDLHVRTEEELLRMQEEFLAQNSRPAAKLTRISRRAPPVAASDGAATAASAGGGADHSAGSAAGHTAGGASSGGPKAAGPQALPGAAAAAASAALLKPKGPKERAAAAAAAMAAGGSGSLEQQGQGQGQTKPQEPKSILGPIEGLLGDIVERPSPAAALPPEPPAAAVLGPVAVVRDMVAPLPEALPAATPGADLGPGASFPEAPHRRQSKFALSRKAKQPQLEQVQQQQQQAPAAEGGPSPAPTSRLPAGPTLRVAPAAPPATASGTRPVTRSTLSDWSVLPTGPVSAAATAADQHALAEAVPREDGGGGGSAVTGGDADASGGELGAIGERNLEAVSRMRPAEVAAALEELSSRISPEAMDFLRRRGAQRLAQQQQQQQRPPASATGSAAVVGPAAAAAGGTAVTAAGRGGPRLPAPRGPRPALAPEMASCATQEDSNALIDSALRALTDPAGGGAGGGAAAAATARRGAALPASVAAPGNPLGSMPIGALAAAQQRQQQQSRGADTVAAAETAPQARGQGQGQGQGGAQGGAPTRGSPADPRLVARLRFDVDGSVVDVQGPEEEFLEDEVLLRDQLRRDEGSAPPGYTLGELLVLCRSAVAAQRAAGLAAIADLAATARPRPEDLQMYAPRPGPGPAAATAAATAGAGAEDAAAADAMREWTPGQMLRRFVPIPEHLRDRAPACSVSWQEVWQFFVSELGLVAHLRLALDDDRPGVLAAAATALAAVLARSESELLAAEMADACPSTGWPAAAGGYLTRHGVTAPWEAAPPAPSPAAPGGGSAASVPPGAADEADAPEDVALVDPLAGALQMGLLQRVRCLLASRHSPGAVLPLLAVLCAAARGGAEAALAVAREPGLLAAVGSLLDPAAAAAAATATVAAGTAAESAAAVGPAVQVAALMLVRLLCSASSVAAHLVRSAGLLALTQAYVLLAGPADGGGGASRDGASASAAAEEQQQQQLGPTSDGFLTLQLLRLEALRTWRVCAHHGISLASLDDLYGNLCHLLLPPMVSQPPPASSPSPSPSSAAVAAAVRQLTAAELYLLLGMLVRHSFAVAGGDATIGRSMLGPGAAAVIAAEALVWLRPAALAGVAAAAVTRCNLSVPLLSATAAATGPSGGLLRVLLGAHPALLLPPAAAQVACLAAVAAFLATYWSTAGALQPVFGDVRGALAASGLLLLPPPAAPGHADADAALPRMSATDALAIELLRTPSKAAGGGAAVCSGSSKEEAEAAGSGGAGAGAGQGKGEGEGEEVWLHQPGSPVGRALVEWALAAVAGERVAAPAAEGAAAGLRLGALAQACLQAAAAALLYGVLQLASAVHRTAGTSTPPAAAGSLAAEVVAAATATCCQAGAAAPAAVGRVLCPWHAAALQRQLHLTRLLLLAGALLPPYFHQQKDDGDGTSGSGSSSSIGDSAGECDISMEGNGEQVDGERAAAREWGEERRRKVQLCMLEGCLAALSASPPGAEGLCLQALRLALRGGLLAAPLRAGYAATVKLAAAASAGSDAKLAAAAAGLPYIAASVAGGVTGDAPFPLPNAPPPAADVADVLFESYAASWLSLISKRRLAAGPATTTAADAAATPSSAKADGSDPDTGAAPPPLPRQDPLELTPVSLQGLRGSRLPAPGQWAMLEAHRLPHQLQRHKQQRGQQQQQQPEGLHPVGCALLLCLGREASGGGGCGGVGAGTLRWLSEGAKAQAALQAAYLFRAEEMMPRDADEASEGNWRDPWVRWSLAGLSRRYLFSRDGSQARPPGPPGPEWLPPALSEQLIAALGSACFGDPLLGAHLALTLAEDASPVVRLQVWNGLAIDKSLHLLPPLTRCLGSATQYLGPPPAAAAAATSGAAPAAPAAPGADTADLKGESEPDPAFLAAVHRSLIEGDLDRALLPPAAAASAAAPPDAASAGAATALAAGAAAAGCASLAGDIGLQLLAGTLLRRERWPALERAWKRIGPGGAAPQHGPGVGGDGGGGKAGASLSAGAMLAALVRSARPEVVAGVVLAAETRCGVRREEAAAVLAQTCSGGDATLRERVRCVLALSGLL